MEIILRDAAVRGSDALVDIGIDGPTIERITPGIPSTAATEIDCDGGFVLPAFVDAHAHLDKAFFRERGPDPTEGTLEESIALSGPIKAGSSKEDIKDRVRRAVRRAVSNGTTAIRTHLDVGEQWDTMGAEAVLEVADELSEIIDIQTVAMPMVRSGEPPGLTQAGRDRIERALEMGVDAVGGEPNKEDTDQLAQETIDEYFEIATTHDAELDMHVDGTNDRFARTVEYVARRTIEEGMQGQVQVGHLCSLAYQNRHHRRNVIELIDRAELSVVTNPKEDQILADHDTTAVSELLDAGVRLSIGHNNIADTISPFGDLDMREPAWLLAHAAEMKTRGEWERLVDCLTHNPAEALGLSDYGLEVGCDASLVVYDVDSLPEVLRSRDPPRLVFKDGQVVAHNRVGRTVGEDLTVK